MNDIKIQILLDYTKGQGISNNEPEPTWERLITACEMLHKNYIYNGYKNRDLVFTFQHLLGGGDKFGNNKNFLPKLEFNKQNLFDRVIMAINFYRPFEEKRKIFKEIAKKI